MNRQSSHSMQVVKREEKEARLMQFVLSEIAAGRVSLDGQWSVVALSMESPVLAALQRVIGDLGEASDLDMQVVLTARGKHAAVEGFEAINGFNMRASDNSRMLDAHEQLVLGDRSSWTGDCMRRNPRERDAFETFAGDNCELASWALKSFERIWNNAQPISNGLGRHARVTDAMEIDNVLAGEGVKANTIVSGTSRH